MDPQIEISFIPVSVPYRKLIGKVKERITRFDPRIWVFLYINEQPFISLSRVIVEFKSLEHVGIVIRDYNYKNEVGAIGYFYIALVLNLEDFYRELLIKPHGMYMHIAILNLVLRSSSCQNFPNMEGALQAIGFSGMDRFNSEQKKKYRPSLKRVRYDPNKDPAQMRMPFMEPTDAL